MRHAWNALLTWSLLLPACELLEQPTGDFYAKLDDAGGLHEGAPVYIAGVRRGRVGHVRLDGERARVDFALDKGDDIVVHEDACVSVGWYGTQEAHLQLTLGSHNKKVLSAGAEVICIDDSAKKADTAAQKAMDVLVDVTKGRGTIGRLFRDEDLADKVERFFASPRHHAPALPTSCTSAAPPGSASPTQQPQK